MEWNICFAVSLLALLAGIVWAVAIFKRRYRFGRLVQPFTALTAGVFVSAYALFLPIYIYLYSGQDFSPIKTLLLTFHNVLRLFVIDEDFSIIRQYVEQSGQTVAPYYTLLAAFLYAAAPLLTFGAILSFFQNISAYFRYAFSFFRKAYIFSELNDRSLTLAEDIVKNDKKATVVFTDVFPHGEEQNYELVERAKALGALCFKKDILVVNFRLHSRCERAALTFFVIGANEAENVEQALKLIEIYRERENARLYIFSNHEACKMVLASPEPRKLKVRRVDEYQSLIDRQLYESGAQFFRDAVDNEKTGEKDISAVIVGLGRYGTGMLKSLIWYCQMDGYRVTIDAFDADPLAEERITRQCPEIMDPTLNNHEDKNGEMRCLVRVHAGISTDSLAFAKELEKLQNATYVLVCLGSDEANIKYALEVRKLYEQMRRHRPKAEKPTPRIQAIVQNGALKKTVCNITTFKNEPYNIEFIGDNYTCYTEKVILNPELEQSALRRHLKYGKEEDFWRYEYNYHSSIASAIHLKARIDIGAPGAGKQEQELTEEEKQTIALLEHRRWNAYMRTQGYIYSGSREKSSRNDLGKMHHDLVGFQRLSEDDINKDIRVGSE